MARQGTLHRLLKLLGFSSPAMLVAVVLSFLGFQAPLEWIEMLNGQRQPAAVDLPRPEPAPGALEPAVIQSASPPRPVVEATPPRHQEPVEVPTDRRNKPHEPPPAKKHNVARFPDIDFGPVR